MRKLQPCRSSSLVICALAALRMAQPGSARSCPSGHERSCDSWPSLWAFSNLRAAASCPRTSWRKLLRRSLRPSRLGLSCVFSGTEVVLLGLAVRCPAGRQGRSGAARDRAPAGRLLFKRGCLASRGAANTVSPGAARAVELSGRPACQRASWQKLPHSSWKRSRWVDRYSNCGNLLFLFGYALSHAAGRGKSYVVALFHGSCFVCVFALFLELEDTGSADAAEDETVTADSLRKLAAELGERAPPRIRQLLVRLRDALPCLQGLAADLGVPFENAVRETLIQRIVLSLCPLASPSMSADAKCHVWRLLRKAREAPEDSVAALICCHRRLLRWLVLDGQLTAKEAFESLLAARPALRPWRKRDYVLLALKRLCDV